MLLTYPLEQVRTLVQTGELAAVPSKYSNFGSTVGRILFIVFDHPRGLRFLYQGCPAVVETVAVSNFFYFYTTQYVRGVLATHVCFSANQLALCSSTVGAVVNILATEPLWKANTVLKTSKKSGGNLVSVILELGKKEGIFSLWKGTLVSLWLVSNPIIQFTVYEYLKRLFLQRTRSRRAYLPVHAFLFGALSKAVATIATYPLQVAQTRLRAQSGGGILEVLGQLYASRGVEGMFHGWSAKLTQTVLTAAFMFAFYERIVRALIVVGK